MKKPEDVERWYLKNRAKIQQLIDNPRVPAPSRKALKKAFLYLENAIENNSGIERKSFIRRNWLKIIVMVFFILLFLAAGTVAVGFAGLETAVPFSLSNTEILVTFFTGGWSIVWRLFLGMLSAIGLFKLAKWLIFR